MAISPLTKYQRFIDKLPTSTRTIILAVILSISLVVWHYNYWKDIQASMTAKSKKIKILKSSIPRLESKLRMIENRFKTKQTMDADKKRSRSLSSSKTKSILHDLLMANKHLALLQLKNTPPVASVVDKTNTKVFQHGIVIKFSGDYFSTMSYLQELQKLPWKIFWDKLEYKVIEYPSAEITLYIHTISNKSEWINV